VVGCDVAVPAHSVRGGLTVCYVRRWLPIVAVAFVVAATWYVVADGARPNADITTTWCASCSLVADCFFETIENALAVTTLFVCAGSFIGVLERVSVRAWP
jgi:hypothetical protein